MPSPFGGMRQTSPPWHVAMPSGGASTPSAPLRIGAHVRDSSLADLGGEHWAKPVPPEPDGLLADIDAALGQQILDVAQRQGESHVHHHDQTDDLRRAIEITERVAHGLKLPRRGAAGFLPDSTAAWGSAKKL